MLKKTSLLVVCSLFIKSYSLAQNEIPNSPKTGTPYDVSEEREPCNQHNPMRSPHFGDMHVHTAWSFDASSQDTRNTPLDAYEFAQGKLTGIQPYDENDQAVRHIPVSYTHLTLPTICSV